jgi:SAM-dependent methyltransferase
VSDLAAAYSASGRAWQAGPGPLYDRLADVVVGLAPVPLAGRVVLDVGAGTGAVSYAVRRAGGRPVALDVAAGMLDVCRAAGLPVLAGDARALPLRTGAVGGVVAAFSLTHVDEPERALREAVRITAPGGPVVASAYAASDGGHPVKDAVGAALRAQGWAEPDWYDRLRTRALPALATPERCLAAARAAGLDAVVHEVRVPFAGLDAEALVDWRLGMAQVAPFLAGLPADRRAAVRAEALHRLGERWPLLVRTVLVVAGTA